MNDEQFELAMLGLEDEGFSDGVAALRARDTAQCEALAQMKTERDQYDELHLESVALAARHEQALARVEAELAEAVGLIRETLDEMFFEDYPKLEDFLTRIHRAQAEQQEAQGQSRSTGSDYFETLDDILNSPCAPCEEEAQDAQAGEFQREDRYIVIKRTDLEKAPTLMAHALRVALDGLREHLPKRECLVIESDWPEYEQTWAAIRDRATGQGAQAGDERAAFEVLWERLNIRGYARKDEAREFWNQGYRAALATQPAAMPSEISLHLMGTIVDEVFDGGIEDASVISDIYRVIARVHNAAVRGAEHE